MMNLNYELMQEEIEETLLCLDWRREGIYKKIHIWILSLVAAGCIIWYLRRPECGYCLLLAAVSIMFLFYLIYFPSLKRKRKAFRMVKQKGIYQVKVPECTLEKAMESEHVFTLTTKEETYCIPKRILQRDEEHELRRLIRENAANVYYMKTGR